MSSSGSCCRKPGRLKIVWHAQFVNGRRRKQASIQRAPPTSLQHEDERPLEPGPQSTGTKGFLGTFMDALNALVVTVGGPVKVRDNRIRCRKSNKG